ncbi:hypothetical protein N9039_02890 [Verrucomicrobiales bacterium]|nr:hypothetical protein [Verrucomicrobiales bacterium]
MERFVNGMQMAIFNGGYSFLDSNFIPLMGHVQPITGLRFYGRVAYSAVS